MYLTSHFFEHLRDQISISDVIRQKINLTKRGQEYTGLCPFHSEKTPSFTVNDIKKFYHCFGCGAHGDVIRFVAETSGMAYQEAAIKLAENNGIVVPQPTAAQAKIYEETEEVLRVLAIANQFFVSQLTKQAKDYLYERKITDSEIKEYCIGYVPAGSGLQKYLEGKKIPLKTMYSAGLVGKSESGDIYSIFKNRITFPIKNIYGKIIAFGGRIIGDGHPKYLNSPETMVFKKSDTLYGENIANGAAYHKKRIIVVEGYLDVIAMHSIGFVETVATLGTAITSQHLLKLWKISDEIIFCMDGDDAGIRAMQKVIFTLLPLIKNQNKASFVMLPKGLDPDEVARGYGKTYLEGIINARLAVSEMIWHLETDRKKFTSAESKSALEMRLEEYIQIIANNTLARYMKSDFRTKIWSLGKKSKAPHSNDLLHLASHTSFQVVCYNLFVLIIKVPSLLSDEEIYNQFLYLDLWSDELEDLRSSILELYSTSNDIEITQLESSAQNSRFYNVFVLLCKSKAPFIDSVSLDNSKLDPKLLWKLWSKKYEYEVLKREYAQLIAVMSEKSFIQSQEYINEMRGIEDQINELNDILLGN